MNEAQSEYEIGAFMDATPNNVIYAEFGSEQCCRCMKKEQKQSGLAYDNRPRSAKRIKKFWFVITKTHEKRMSEQKAEDQDSGSAMPPKHPRQANGVSHQSQPGTQEKLERH